MILIGLKLLWPRDGNRAAARLFMEITNMEQILKVFDTLFKIDGYTI